MFKFKLLLEGAQEHSAEVLDIRGLSFPLSADRLGPVAGHFLLDWGKLLGFPVVEGRHVMRLPVGREKDAVVLEIIPLLFVLGQNIFLPPFVHLLEILVVSDDDFVHLLDAEGLFEGFEVVLGLALKSVLSFLFNHNFRLIMQKDMRGLNSLGQ